MSEFVSRRLRSGQTMRYHTTPHIGQGQTVAEHSWRACVLMHTLWPQHVTKAAIVWMMYHDSAEQELGDMPAPAKWNFPVLADCYYQHEQLIEQELEIHEYYDALTEDEKTIVQMADMLECLDHVAHRIMRGDHSFEARKIYWNARKHLEERFSKSVLFEEARKFMRHLHTRVVPFCPAVASHA